MGVPASFGKVLERLCMDGLQRMDLDRWRYAGRNGGAVNSWNAEAIYRSTGSIYPQSIKQYTEGYTVKGRAAAGYTGAAMLVD